MDSTGRNRILPVETVQIGISSDSKIGNQIATISKTEKPFKMAAFGQLISKTTDNEKDSLHYVSWLFGIVLTCAGLTTCLIVPWHNVLKEPFYWYEIHMYVSPIWLTLHVACNIMALEYYANIKHEKQWTTFFILSGIGGLIYTVILLVYFYIYVYYFELLPPLPFGSVIVPTLTAFALMFILSLRYCHSYLNI